MREARCPYGSRRGGVIYRHRLGSWKCASGNSVDAFYIRSASELGLALEWDFPPPLCDADQVDYEQTILPAIVQRVQQYLSSSVRQSWCSRE